MVSDALPGVPLCLTVYMLYAGILPARRPFAEVRAVNVVLLLGWVLHYVYRGFVHPFIMPYSSPTVAIGITLAGTFPNILFSYLTAAQLGCTVYPARWGIGARFLIGVAVYVMGTVINRWADLKLRAGRLAMRRQRRDAASASSRAHQPPSHKHGAAASAAAGAAAGAAATGGDSDDGQMAAAVREALLRAQSGGIAGSAGREGKDGPPAGGAPSAHEQRLAIRSKYFIPRGGLFELVSCPNYFGELLEWTGFALASWSWPSLAWALFCASTFIPRSLTHHRWYKDVFGDEYPAGRRALIPYLL
ncbi:hypothetical protein GPECTOR_23g98 [Gonium pectorale]|uniref:3-oxo-5-alpha-steroid 4-dehydrogenase C-terminal domain-containing protein n=1 Tax=Gonium pectorale TaxID=33097 RepID=A0A150GH46_GONPE|nr:hypothetical protein GPECTOR_23g98 [Gonium pectorale]|eukprot:KXZ49171.1 hypothetical protein GPECTOR_23g98 [Gonium pectorale]